MEVIGATPVSVLRICFVFEGGENHDQTNNQNGNAIKRASGPRHHMLAFSADPIVRWFYPDPHEYCSIYQVLFGVFAGKAFEHNSAYYIAGYLGAALLLPPDVHPDETALVALLQRTIPEENQQEIFAFIEPLERCDGEGKLAYLESSSPKIIPLYQWHG